jgi:hypothetical protein
VQLVYGTVQRRAKKFENFILAPKIHFSADPQMTDDLPLGVPAALAMTDDQVRGRQRQVHR